MEEKSRKAGTRRSVLQTFMRWGLPALFLPLAIGACGDDDSPTDFDEQTSVSVYLTDAPGDVESVWVQVDDVVLIAAGGDEEEEDGENGQESLLDEPTDLIELTDLVGVTETLSSDVAVEPGVYAQLRLVLGGAVLLTEGGDVYSFGDVTPPDDLETTGELKCPSCSQSGLKVVFPGGVELVEGDDVGILLDFDVSQSFGRQAGMSGMWVMRPVIIAKAGDDEDVEDGGVESTITGTVALDTDVSVPACGGDDRSIEDFVPLATAQTLTDDEGGSLSFSGETDADGEFEIEVLGADTYDLEYATETTFDGEELSWTATVDPATATVESDGDLIEGVAYTITGVTCDAVSS